MNVGPVLLLAVALVAFAAWLAADRRSPRQAGLVVGTGLALLALGLASVGGPLPWLVLDGVSTPRVGVVAVLLLATVGVLPTRQATGGATAALVVAVGVDLACVVAPAGALPALWPVACGATWGALPQGANRRVAAPYLALAAVLGGLGLAGLGPCAPLLVLVAVALRLGVFPVHSWAVAAYDGARPTGAVLLVAPMASLAVVARAPIGLDGLLGQSVAAALALSALVSAGLAIVQRGLGRAVGFLTSSVVALVLVGLLDRDAVGHLGGLTTWNLTGVALTGLGLVTSALLSRHRGPDLRGHGGLLASTPFLAVAFLLFGLAAVGAPGTADFVGEDLVIHGSLSHHPWLLLLHLAAVSAQAYAVLHVFMHAFFGPEGPVRPADALPRERVALVALGGLVIAAGMAPQLMVDVFGGW